MSALRSFVRGAAVATLGLSIVAGGSLAANASPIMPKVPKPGTTAAIPAPPAKPPVVVKVTTVPGAMPGKCVGGPVEQTPECRALAAAVTRNAALQQSRRPTPTTVPTPPNRGTISPVVAPISKPPVNPDPNRRYAA